MENKICCYLQNIHLPNISCTCSSQSWCACWLSGLGVYHTFFPSHLTPSSSCGNKPQVQGEKQHTAASRQISSLEIPKTTRLWWSCAGQPVKINHFLREITEVSTCVVAESPHSQGRFPHLSLVTEKEEG